MTYVKELMLNDTLPPASYVYDLPVVQYLLQEKRLPFCAPVTFLVGENGSGKSTLIEAIATAFGFNPEGGSRNFTFSTNDSHSELWKHITLAKGLRPRDGFFLRAEAVYNVASDIDDMDSQEYAFVNPPMIIDGFGGVSLHEQSHGESFLSIVQHRFFGHGLYILDEPEAALSPTRQMTLLLEIDRLVKADSQLIIATHSPILMAYPHAEILQCDENGIRSVSFRDTEHYRITKLFLDQPERMIEKLLSP